MADSDVTGGALAGPGFGFLLHGVPEVYLGDPGVQTDALVDGTPVQDAAGCQLHMLLE